MYISRIELENIRGFRSGDLRVDLDLRRPDGRYAGWTVIAGRNGAGKSTFLKAVALAVAGPSAAMGLHQGFAGWIREGEKRAVAATDLLFDEAVDAFFIERGVIPGGVVCAELVWLQSGTGPEPTIDSRIRRAGRSPKAGAPAGRFYKNRIHGPWEVNPTGWFIAGYGPYRRLTGQVPDARQLSSGPPQVARLVNLFREDVSLIESIQWLKELHLRRLEGREGAEELLDGVLELLSDGLLPEGTKVVKFDSEGLWLSQGGVTLPLRDMSDGYRTMAAFVLDLVRHIHGTYEEFKLSRQKGGWCVPYPGVVLVDEVEQHLHVSWQRRIGFWLKEHFPNIQFIVTTHSPFVCQAADPKGLIRLPAPGEQRSAEHVSDELYKTVVNGTVDEAALTELFGLEHVHSDRSEELREQVARLEARILRGEATPEERERMEQLSSQLPDTASTLMERALRKYGLDK
jgi:energy-coupling factor transporter ATP-binding protein EcfA2